MDLEVITMSPVRIRHDVDNHVAADAAGVPPDPESGNYGWRFGWVDIGVGVPRRREAVDAAADDDEDIAVYTDDEGASEIVGRASS